ncbi:MAG: hypothetical protein R3F34_06565 [Planctomycetota bacterium]
MPERHSAVCDDCDTTFAVKDPNKAYACKHCGGVVRVPSADDDFEDDFEHGVDDEPEDDPSDDAADPYAPPHAPARTRQRSDRARAIADDRAARSERARAFKNVENVLRFIGLILSISIFFGAMRILAMLAMISAGDREALAAAGDDGTQAAGLISLGAEIFTLVLVILARKNLRKAPVVLVGIVAGFKTLQWLIVAAPLLEDSPFGGPGGTSAAVVLAVLTIWAAFFWYSFFVLRKNKSLIEEWAASRESRRR